ncbi:MAG TPA: penicillin acylase family protein [Pyrinomonadaceae bacterium]
MQRKNVRWAFVFALFALWMPLYGQLPVAGLKANVTVRRDARGIPYIEAGSDADLYFAQGYVTASDRLWQMDLMRRLARGETAEIFGDKVLEEDKRWRRFDFAKVAEDNLQYLSPELRSALDDYARGVNAYIDSLTTETLPVEFRILQYRPRAWTATDTIVVGKILDDALSSTWRLDLLRASLRNLPAEKFADLTNQVTNYDVVLFGNDKKPAAVAPRPGAAIPSSVALNAAERDMDLRQASLEKVGLYAEDLAASNNWVISGKKTADGKPILANDPHLQPTAPGIWYMSELSAPDVHVAGVTFPGVPGIVLGHNDSIAWGATNVGPDVQDLYYETFNSDGKYKTPTGWAEPVVRKETIKVRTGFTSPATHDVEFDVTETRNGPVIIEDGGRKYALRWTALDPKNVEFETFFKFDRAQNWDVFKTALKAYGGAAQNFVYADEKGNIGWYAAGKIPIRRTGDGGFPYDGSTNDGDWIGFIPFEELPNLYDPPTGLIVTANQRTVGLSYKYTQFARDVAAPWRARRIYDRLSSKAGITFDDVRATQLDVLNIPLDNLAKNIVQLNAASAESLATLKGWDGRMVPDSTAALLSYEIRGCLANEIADDNKPVPASVIRELILDWAIRDRSILWLPKKYANYTDFLRSCDTNSRQALTARLGADTSKWVWGTLFRATFPHPLAPVPLIGGQFATPSIPIAGSGQTPDVGPSVSMRFIASPGNWDATSHVIPLGESGDPRSAHFKDQFDMWLNDRPPAFSFSKQAIEKTATDVTILSPK